MQHHGILGMKWGVRRYQNEDGSYTTAGRARYYGKDPLEKPKKARVYGQDPLAKTTTVTKKRTIADMTDEELLRDNKRRALENQYKKNHPEPKSKLQSTKDAADQTQRMTNQMRELNRQISTQRRKAQPWDVSGYSDDELRRAINRKNLERQYSDLFAEPDTISRGQAAVDEILNYTGLGLGIASSALGIALAVKELNKG